VPQVELITMREAAVPLLEAAGVDLVLCGHSHAYERSALAKGMVGESGAFDAATMWWVRSPLPVCPRSCHLFGSRQ
jgi:hypothetical protein